jgi:hypothetical protein
MLPHTRYTSSGVSPAFRDAMRRLSMLELDPAAIDVAQSKTALLATASALGKGPSPDAAAAAFTDHLDFARTAHEVASQMQRAEIERNTRQIRGQEALRAARRRRYKPKAGELGHDIPGPAVISGGSPASELDRRIRRARGVPGPGQYTLNDDVSFRMRGGRFATVSSERSTNVF